MGLYPVPAAGYNGINQHLFPFDVSSELLREWVQATPLYKPDGGRADAPDCAQDFRQGRRPAIPHGQAPGS